MTKALPPAETFSAPVGMIPHMHGSHMKELTRHAAGLRNMARSIAKRLEGDREQNSRAQFFKSLGAARALVGANIAAGKITCDDAIKAEAKLNRLFDRGLEIIAAEARQ